MERSHVMLAKPQMFKTAFQFCGINKEVRDDDDQRPLPNRLGDFVEDAGGMVDKVERALVAGQSKLARDEVHALKGASRSLGAVALGDAASDVQDLIDRGAPAQAALAVARLRAAREALARLVGGSIAAM